MNHSKSETDVLIVGSGPVGASFARVISEALPETKIVMVDLGPRLGEKAGMHVRNMADEKTREWAQIQSQGFHKRTYPLITVAERAAAVQIGKMSLELLARPGTHLLSETEADLKSNEMPAAALSTNVGGMGVHWTCACPRPGNAERIPFIPDDEYETVFKTAERLLCVTQSVFPSTPEGEAIQQILGKIFNPRLSESRKVQPMPLACAVDAMGEPYWAGPDIILGDLAQNRNSGNFEIRSDTLCRQLIIDRGMITGANLEQLPSHRDYEIKSRVVILACDAFRTPQLLWASGIRPPALGHYLNEHPFIFTFVELKEDLVDRGSGISYDPGKRKDQTIGIYWVPYESPGHPFHGQIMHMDISPLKINTRGNPKHIVGLGWGCPKEVRYEDQILFSETEKDSFGMPKMQVRFHLTEKDKKEIEKAKRLQREAAEAFGRIIREGDQTLMPAGTSLHAQGTVRMGEKNDGNSVCDSHGQIWGYDNLFVGGNGIIPMSTTSNPTLTSVAMAVRSAGKIIETLRKS